MRDLESIQRAVMKAAMLDNREASIHSKSTADMSAMLGDRFNKRVDDRLSGPQKTLYHNALPGSARLPTWMICSMGSISVWISTRQTTSARKYAQLEKNLSEGLPTMSGITPASFRPVVAAVGSAPSSEQSRSAMSDGQPDRTCGRKRVR